MEEVLLDELLKRIQLTVVLLYKTNLKMKLWSIHQFILFKEEDVLFPKRYSMLNKLKVFWFWFKIILLRK